MIQIIKYPNRKLYNKETSKYVSLNEINVMLEKRQSFKVVEFKTFRDITELVIARANVSKVMDRLETRNLSQY
jgi:polyhydroxyalkanoate synthesis regulator protein